MFHVERFLIKIFLNKIIIIPISKKILWKKQMFGKINKLNFIFLETTYLIRSIFTRKRRKKKENMRKEQNKIKF